MVHGKRGGVAVEGDDFEQGRTCKSKSILMGIFIATRKDLIKMGASRSIWAWNRLWSER